MRMQSRKATVPQERESLFSRSASPNEWVPRFRGPRRRPNADQGANIVAYFIYSQDFYIKLRSTGEVTNAKSRARPARRLARVPRRGAGLSIEAGARVRAFQPRRRIRRRRAAGRAQA